MRELTASEKEALKNNRPQKFRVVVLTDNSGYNLSNFNNKSYVKSINKNVSKDNRTATLSLTFEDFKHELKLNYDQLFRANNQIKVYIKILDKWHFVFHGVLGDDVEKITEHANGDISLSQVRDLSKILSDDYIASASKNYSGWAEEVIQELLNDRFGEGVFKIKVPELSEFYIEDYIPEYTSTWDAVQKIADQIGWDLRFLYDKRTDSFRLTFYMPERDPIYYDWEFEQRNIDSEKLSTSDADVRNIVRIRNQKRNIDVTVKDEESIEKLNTEINGKKVGGKRYMEINQEETSLIDTEEEARNLGKAILYDVSTQNEKTRITPRGKRCVYFQFNIHDSILINNSSQRKDPKLFVVDSYSWTAQKGGFNTSITLSDKVTIGYLRWFNKEKRYKKPIDPEELRTEPPANVKDLNLEEQSYVNIRGDLQSDLIIKFNIPNDSRFQDAVIEIKENTDEEFEQIGTSLNGHHRISGLNQNTRYNIRVLSRNYGGITSDGVEETILITGKDSPPPTVEEFIVSQDGTSVNFRWKQVEARDVIGYEIRKGADWPSGRLVATKITGESYKTDREIDGSKKYMIKAIDRGGNYSENAKASIFNVVDTGNELNVLMERDELSKEPSSYDGLYKLDGVIQYSHNLSFSDFPDASFQNPPENLNKFPAVNLESEYISGIIDTGKVGRTGIRIDRSIFGSDPSGSMRSMKNRSFSDFPGRSFKSPPVNYDLSIYIKFSDDNVDWTEWQRFVHGQYKFRYCQFKFVVSTISETAQIEIQELVEIFDVPDVELNIEELSIPSSGKEIVFSDYDANFYKKPIKYFGNVVNDNELKFPVFKNVNSDSLTVELHDINNNAVSGTANITIEGY